VLAAKSQRADDDPAEVMAAVDLGSNSFHMIVARLHHGQLAIVDRLKEMVRLAAGLGRDGSLDAPSQDRALACLRRFGQRLRDMHADQVRVVGTNTLRKARSPDSFLVAAERALEHPVEIISGIEEARLIYSGVSHSVRSTRELRLVVDIGGGSTELIVGEGYEPRHLESLAIGCARLTSKYFADGKLSKKRFAAARAEIALGLRPVAATFREDRWTHAIGSSGTIRATRDIAHALGIIDRGVTPDAAEAVMTRMIDAKKLDKLALPELSAERAPVFPAGVAILAEILHHLGISQMDVSDGALREGLLYEMVGRLQHEDARDRTIRAVEKRYHVDTEQAARVEATALDLLAKVGRDWGISDEPYAHLLVWAARLHEVGLDIAHSRYHQHGGYLLENADLPGFVRLEQQLLATLVRYHRRKLDDFSLDHLQPQWRVPIFRLIVLLRLAVLLNRTRSPEEIPPVGLRARPESLEISFPTPWLAKNPLTEADLQQERDRLRACRFELLLAARA
jgi:exopolyphosphatase/guanosine-5'-triphosphate,3'-diphosphate pyrophosphatase